MIPRRLALLAVLLALLPGRSPAAAEDGLPEVRAWQRGELASLSANASKEGYLQLARRCLLYLGRAGVDQAELEDLATTLAGAEPDQAISAKKREKFDREFAKYREQAARKLAALAAAGGGEADRKLAAEAVRLHPENGDARKLLGQVLVKGWGWLPEADAEQLKAGLLPGQDGWLTKAEAKQDGRFVVVTSDHWRILSRLPEKRTFELRDLLEGFSAKWRDDWEGELPLLESDRRHEVHVLESEGAYEAFLEKTDPGRITGVPGQYSPNLKRAVFYDVESHRTGSNQTSSMVELMLHECTHQIFHEEVEGKFQALEGDAAANLWLHEGIGEYYGMHTLKQGSLVFDRKSVAKMLRTTWLRERLARTQTLPELNTIGRKAFLADGGEQRLVNYAHSGFVCAFLAEGDQAAAFRKLVREVYCEGNQSGLLARRFGEDLGKLDREFKAYFRKL